MLYYYNKIEIIIMSDINHMIKYILYKLYKLYKLYNIILLISY